ncbi:MAG TPA: hypothetical protein VL970_01740 [Candidatus Acidoferrales bacterium]|nr:hypothetical protein [Candidatus Acidoferrales bacterium]
MNLGKLLIVGRSIFGGGEAVAYRLNGRARLPKFNDGKNPFAPKTPEAAPEAAKENIVARAAAPAPKTPPPYAFKPGAKTANPPAQPAAKPSRPGWTTRLNPFRAPEPAVAAPAVVQAELSLDSVKVMHNDLADADVEIVPVKSHAETVMAAPVLPPARRAWEYVGENLLKS